MVLLSSVSMVLHIFLLWLSSKIYVLYWSTVSTSVHLVALLPPNDSNPGLQDWITQPFQASRVWIWFSLFDNEAIITPIQLVSGQIRHQVVLTKSCTCPNHPSIDPVHPPAVVSALPFNIFKGSHILSRLSLPLRHSFKHDGTLPPLSSLMTTILNDSSEHHGLQFASGALFVTHQEPLHIGRGWCVAVGTQLSLWCCFVAPQYQMIINFFSSSS